LLDGAVPGQEKLGQALRLLAWPEPLAPSRRLQKLRDACFRGVARNGRGGPGFVFKQPRRSIMLGKADATPMIAVTDLDRARKFYEDKLGLETEDDWGEGFTLKSGDTLVNVYRSEFAGT